MTYVRRLSEDDDSQAVVDNPDVEPAHLPCHRGCDDAPASHTAPRDHGEASSFAGILGEHILPEGSTTWGVQSGGPKEWP